MSEEVAERRPLLEPERRVDRHNSRPTSHLRRLSSGAIPPYDSYDKDSIDETQPSSSSVAIWTVVPILLIGVFVANGDTSLVIASNTKISSEFRALKDASWLITSYALAQCASQPLYGKLSDIFGRKSNLAVAYTIFALGCLTCGIGQTYWQVILGRALSGLGSAGMTALVSIVIVDMVSVRQVASWRSYVNIVATIGRSLGGPVGGWLTDTIGWRASFNLQVPLTLAGLLLVIWRVPSWTRTDDHDSKAPLSKKIKRVDFLGAVSLACCISALLMFLDLFAKQAPWWQLLVSALVTVFCGLAFYLIETRFAHEPVLPMHLLAKRVPLTAYSLIGFQVAGQFSMYYIVPIYFQITAGDSVSAAGLRLVPAVVGNAIGGILSGILVSRTGRYKILTIFASATATVGHTLVLIRWHGATPWLELSYFFLGGFGIGIIQSTTYIHLAGNLEASDMAIAGATLFMVQTVWMLVGIQITTFILKASLRSSLDDKLSHFVDKAKIIEQSLQSVDLIRKFPDSVRQLVTSAYISSMSHTFVFSVVFSSIAFLIGLTIQEKRL